MTKYILEICLSVVEQHDCGEKEVWYPCKDIVQQHLFPDYCLSFLSHQVTPAV